MGRYWLQTLGCPKNQVDSDKLEGYLEAQGYVPASGPAGGRPGRRQHLRVHRCGPPGVDRHRPRAGRPAPRAAHASSSPAAWPSATATSCATRCPRSTWWPGSGRDARRARGAVPVALRAGAPPPPAPRRTVRASTSSSCPGPPPAPRGPTSRSPRAVTASAASAPSRPSGASSARDSRGDPGRGRRAQRRPGCGAATDGPPLREIVLVAQDLASYGRDRTGPGRAVRIAGGPSPIAALTRSRGRRASTAPGCSISIPRV